MLTGGDSASLRRRSGMGCNCQMSGEGEALNPSLALSPVVHTRVKSLTSIIGLLLGVAGIIGVLVKLDRPRRVYRSGEGRSKLGLARARETVRIPTESMVDVVDGRLR